MRKALFALGLTASLLASGASQPSLLDPLWAFLSSIWTGQPSDIGCGMDPDGRCSTRLQPTYQDEGCGWDPDGRCQPNPQPDSEIGCGMDPSGCPKGS